MKKLVLLVSFMVILPVFSFDIKYDNASDLYKKINPAIVSIDSHFKGGISCGTGCVIDDGGTILTSAHILEDGNDIIVTMSNGED